MTNPVLPFRNATLTALTLLPLSILLCNCATEDGSELINSAETRNNEVTRNPQEMIFLGGDILPGASAGDLTDDGKPHSNASELGKAKMLSDGDEPQVEKGVYMSSSVWQRFEIPVCWETGGFVAERDWIQKAIETSWEANSGIDFTMWSTCGSTSPGIHIKFSDEQAHTVGLGRQLDGVANGMVLNMTFNLWNTSCADPSRRESCIRTIAIHEFGHALGLTHEHINGPVPADCNEVAGSPTGDAMVGGFDSQSIMNYCYGSSFSGVLSAGDINTIRQLYPLSRKTDVGVIKDYNVNCPGDAVTIGMDDEDTNNSNARSGWIGAWRSDTNTTMAFCRVPGDYFKHLAATGSPSSNYAVLRLGATCPNYSTPFTRYIDNEDNDNANSKRGDVRPSIVDTNSRLEFCVFTGGYTNRGAPKPRAATLPDLGFSYGVFAAPEFAFGSQRGSVSTDDEDNQNQNSWTGFANALSIINASENTTFNMWRR